MKTEYLFHHGGVTYIHKMPNKNYLRGVRLEREVVNIFKKAGYSATRTAGSHSPYDVIIWKENEKLKKIIFVAFAQCKTKVQS